MHPTDDILNDYVDAALDADEAISIEAHLRGCDDCRNTVADIRAVRRAASSLPPLEPPVGAWGQIRKQLDQPSVGSRQSTVERRQSSVESRQASVESRQSTRHWRMAALAAAAVLVLATAAGLGFLLRQRGVQPESGNSVDMAGVAAVDAELRQAEEHYRKAIEGLERIAAANRSALDPQTAETLQTNLAVVDRAITESRAALQAEPSSEPAQASLLDSFKSKLALLEDTVALINEMRKGNDAGAAHIVSNLKRGT